MSSINDVEANTPDDEWTPRRLERRMIEAIKVVEATTRRTGPAGARGYWPETYDLFQDEVGQVQQGTYLLGGNRIRFQATQAQMRRSDEALQWPKRHVQDLRVLKVFNAWLASKAYRLKWARVVKAHGWSLATADRCRDRAKAEIIQGLIAEGVRHQ
ncbi:MAG: hypothetical protein O9972_22195 [Burkholderiales bacterium]|nr:hypothetical protein [Burkholderiales bacterium]